MGDIDIWDTDHPRSGSQFENLGIKLHFYRRTVAGYQLARVIALVLM